MTADILFLDLETRSRCDLIGRGLEAYARDPSTEVLMCGWAVNDAPVSLWQRHTGKAPAELRDALKDPAVLKIAHNAPFEQAIFTHVLRMPLHPLRDTMVMAYYASLPGALGELTKAIGLSEDKQKLQDGKRLIRKFSVPHTPSAAYPAEWRDRHTDPEDWELFCDYCRRDVESEREVHRRLARFPLPEHEWNLWALDQEINLRGLPVDLVFVEQANRIAALEKIRLKREFKRVTGLDMATTARFLPWAREHGYPFNDMRKDSVRRALEQGVSDELRYALEIRGDLNRTSLAKYEVLAEAQYQGRLYHSFQFGGAARTLRWAGRKVQPQNLARPIKALDNRIEEATDLVRAGEYDELYMRFGRVTPVLVSLVRSSFRAPEGRVLGVADYNAIENRVIGWTAECEATLAIFKNNLDPYKSFGTRLYNKAYDTITKDERNNSKAPVLGGGYRLGGGDEKANKNGDVLKTGLWGYAEAMGIKLTRDEAHRAVAVFRETFPAIVKLWYRLEDAAHYAVEQHLTTQVGPVVFDYQPGVMRIRLPSGRYLHYLRPKYIEKEFEGRDGAYVKRVLTYDGMDSTPGGNKKWGRLTTHGGKLTENIVQAIARDVLAVGMTRAKRAGFEIIGHAHDEIIVEMPAKPLMGVGVLCELMSQPIGWAPGLPLKAEGFESAFYRK